MDIIDKAKELGRMIAESDKMQALQEAELQMENDERATRLMKEYSMIQVQVVKATREKKEQEILDELREQLMAKHNEINEYGTTRNYLEAKSDFDSFVKTINDTIIYSITGEDPCSPDKCSSCGSGCC